MRITDSDIKEGVFHRIYLLTGSESYLRRQYVNRLLLHLLNPNDTFHLTKFRDNSYPAKDLCVQIMQAADTFPMMAPYRVVLLEDCQIFKAADDAFLQYLSHIPETTVMIINEAQADKRTRLYKAIKQYGVIEELNMPTERELNIWLLNKAKKANKQMTKSAYALFIEMTDGADMEYMHNEFEKLLSYCHQKDAIEKEDVKAICSAFASVQIFDLINAIAARNKTLTFQTYRKLLEVEEAPMRVLSLITSQFRRLYNILDLQDGGLSLNDIANRLGVKSYAIKKSMESLRLFSNKQLIYLIEEAVNTEFLVKSGQMQEQIGVELFIRTCLDMPV